MPRIPALAKLLPHYGWEPIILTKRLRTAHDLECTIVETDCRNKCGRLISALNLSSEDDVRVEIKQKLGFSQSNRFFDYAYRSIAGCLTYPDVDEGWKPFAIEEGRQFLDASDVDILLSSSSPVASHRIAHELKNQYDIPWIADFRDLWSQNHNYGYGPIRKTLDERLERRTLRSADFLTTVSPVWAEGLKKLHDRATVCTINNGFDSNVFDRPKPELSFKFTITYMGGIYHKKQNPTTLFVALKELISNGTIEPKDVEVRFYGV